MISLSLLMISLSLLMISLSLLTISFLHFDIYVYLIPFAYARLETTIGARGWLRQGKLLQLNLDVSFVFLILSI